MQETKLEVVTPTLCYTLWGCDDCDWEFKPSDGSSGGILSLWHKSNSVKVNTFQGEGYVGVSLDWGVEKKRCVIVNVYSKCDLASKRRLWEHLLEERRNRGEEAWCVVGDFNVVCSRDERKGINEEISSSQLLEMSLFNNFISEVELDDMSVLGRRFTWYHPNGRSMSRIDRVFISKEWFHMWGDNSLWVLPRDVSD